MSLYGFTCFLLAFLPYRYIRLSTSTIFANFIFTVISSDQKKINAVCSEGVNDKNMQQLDLGFVCT